VQKAVRFLSGLDFKLIIIFLCLVVYLPTVTYEFIWDDFVLYREFIQRDYIDLITTRLDSIYSIHYYPVLLLTHKIDYFLSQLIFIDQVDRAHFTYAIIPHVTNVILYILTCYCFYLVTQIFFKQDKIQILLTCIFILHPLHVNSVAWVSGRTDLLATLFCLSTLVCFYQLIQKKNLKYLLLTCLMYSLAVFSKIISLTFIGVLFLTFIYFLYLKKERFLQHRFVIYFFIFTVFLFTLYFYLFFKFTMVQGSEKVFFESASFNDFFRHLLNPISFYLTKIFFPFNHFTISSPVPSTGLMIINLILFLFLLSFSVYRAYEKKDFLLLCFILFIFCTLSTGVYSYFRSLEDERLVTLSSLAERYGYMASFASVLVIGYFLNFVSKKYQTQLAFALIIVFFFFSILRVPVHENYLTYALKNKENDRKQSHYGVIAQAYNEMGQTDEAIKVLQYATQKYPKLSFYYVILANEEDKRGNVKKAERYRSKARALHQNDQKFFYKAGIFFYEQRQYEVAKSYFIRSIFLDKKLLNVIQNQIYLARIEMDQGNYELSNKMFKNIIDIDPLNAEAHYYTGLSYLKMKDKKQAIFYIQKAASLNSEILEWIQSKK